IGDKGMVSFSVFDYQPIELINGDGRQVLEIENPKYIQKPLIEEVVKTLQGTGDCKCTSITATPTNWAMDYILGKF
ncbi:MAG: gfo/Idh/MocA family oxidoreductase, partial [Bacteroidaceae bacterium]|nr:gfo/Idh/MocA family oxidoreductase [Bacteroidaceae bacterium]